MNFRLVTPNGQAEITLSSPYGSNTLKNGLILPDSPFVRSYPEYFHAIPEIKPVLVPAIKNVSDVSLAEKWSEVLKSASNTDAKADLRESVETPVKRNPGRPRKNFTN
jgi:hypothetical protein